ncbi:MAG: hypothetical protein Q7R52_05450 [archaeon]|nr:hypothetical protein [archaeon]
MANEDIQTKGLGDLIEEMFILLNKNPNIMKPENNVLTGKCEDYKIYIAIKTEINNGKYRFP